MSRIEAIKQRRWHMRADGRHRYLFAANAKSGHRAISLALGRHCHRRSPGFIARLYSDEELDSMFFFTVVRNPYKRAVSSWQHLMKWRKERPRRGVVPMSFLSFCRLIKKEGAFDKHIDRQCVGIEIDGQLTVDYVAKLEDISNDWEVVRTHLPHADPVLHHKKHIGPITDHWLHYCDESAEIIRDFYRDDFRYFNYPLEIEKEK